MVTSGSGWTCIEDQTVQLYIYFTSPVGLLFLGFDHLQDASRPMVIDTE